MSNFVLTMEKGNANLHFLDRYVGIPIVFFLGLFRLVKKKIPNTFTPERIAILNISSIGDNVLMSGPLLDLQKRYPNATITVFCGETNFATVKMIPGVAQVYKLVLNEVKTSIGLIRAGATYDLMIDFGPWPRLNSIYAAFFKAKYKIGFFSKGQLRHFVYDYAVPHSDQKHELDNFRALLSPLNIQSEAMPALKVEEKRLEERGEYILLHPWPGGYKSFMKEWPKENWISLIEKLRLLKLPIYITGAPADVSVSSILQEKSNNAAISLAGKYNLADTALLVKNAKLLVTVNTGIMHMGAALGTRLIALHGPTSVKRWGPVTKTAINVAPRNSACGYLHYGYEYDRSTVNCMELITVDEVYQNILKQIFSNVA